MKLRRRALSKKASIIFLSIIVACLVWILSQLIFVSLDENHPWRIYFSNNLIIELGVALLTGIIVGVTSLRRGICFLVPIWGDDRNVFSKDELNQKFSLDAGFSPILEDGWKATGNGMQSHSNATFKSPIGSIFSITAEFKPLRNEPQNSYWRTGFLLTNKDGAQQVCVHTDNHNLLVGYINNTIHIRVPVRKPLEGHWSLLSLELSESEIQDKLKVFCHLDRESYFLGNVDKSAFPCNLVISTWSDKHRNHIVTIRDISVSRKLA